MQNTQNLFIAKNFHLYSISVNIVFGYTCVYINRTPHKKYGIDFFFSFIHVHYTGQVLSATKDTIQNTMGRLWNNASNTLVSWWGDTASRDVDSENDDDDER